MKKTILAFQCSLLVATAITAQPVLLQNNMAGPGTDYTMRSTTLGNPAFSTYNGENLSWDFENDGDELTSYRNVFLDPSSIAGGVPVENCNLVISNVYETEFGNDTSFSYMEVNAEGFYMRGYGDVGFPVISLFEPARLVYPFPLSYGTQFNSSYRSVYQDAFGEELTDSVRSIVNESTDAEVIGYGALTINGTPFTALLMELVSDYSDSSFMYQNGEWSFIGEFTQQSFIRQWVDANSGVMLMEESEEEGEKGGINYRYTFYFNGNIVLPTQVSNPGKASGVLIYPNPAIDWIRVQNSEGIETLRIYSLDGRLLSQHDGNKDLQLDVNLSSLSAGLYLVEVIHSGGTRTLERVVRQ